ncbi:hypothetical protein B0T21DRAFT_413186 [Apiosordaria backusii]|uniref:Uncharacterized protein n=1 Tax=Apiosordaria backusii TaxID=314023 RepID=A0AA40B7H4_9PEZI|nr:hypothetical protein B0T21DRAFT_413186 [Apiosordaria backusii]
MSQYDGQSTHSSWDMMPDADFSVDKHTRERSPQRNENNFSSNQIGFGAATSVNTARPPVAVSNEDSTETAGTNDTVQVDGAATQYPGGMTTATYAPTAYPETTDNYPDLTQAAMEQHHERTYPHDVAVWAGHAGARRLNRYQATSQRYSSSVASTRSADSNTSKGWIKVMEPAPVDEDVLGMGAWSDDALQSVYGSARPGGR